MQPCQVCGSTGVDANGYCTTCSTFRGVPQPQQPQYGAPYGSYPSPQSGVPYSTPPVQQPGYPASAPPGYPTPVSGPASYAVGQSSGAPGYGTQPISAPGYGYAPPPTPPARSWTGAIVAAGVGLVVLIAAIVVVLVVKSNGKHAVTVLPTASTKVSGDPSASAGNPNLDACVVGTWRVTAESYSDDFSTDYTGVPLTLDNTYQIVFTADGRATENFSADDDEADFLGTYNGHDFQDAYSGTVTYNFSTSNGKMLTNGQVSNGKFGQWQDHNQIVERNSNFDDGITWTYSCSGDTMTRQNNGDNMNLTRISKTTT